MTTSFSALALIPLPALLRGHLDRLRTRCDSRLNRWPPIARDEAVVGISVVLVCAPGRPAGTGLRQSHPRATHCLPHRMLIRLELVIARGSVFGDAKQRSVDVQCELRR